MSTHMSMERGTESLSDRSQRRGAFSGEPTRWAAVAGIVFVALQVPIPFLMSGAPAIDHPVNEIRDFLVHDRDRILLATTLVAFASFFFLWFLGGLRSHLHAAEGGDGRVSAIAFGAGVATIAVNVMATMPTVALAWNQTAASADPSLVRTVWNLNTLALVPIGGTAAMFTLAVALVILRTRLLAPWVGWLGLLTTVLSLASLLYLLADGANAVLQTINIAGFLTAMVFVLVVCVYMLCRPSAAAEIGAPGAGSRW